MENHTQQNFVLFPPYRATLEVAKFDSQAVEGRYRQPASPHFHSSESSQHISIEKQKKEHQWQNKEQ
jgi:dethiobiotin synthetase